MTDYVKSTNFASKDSLASGNPLKIVKGTEIDTEFNNIATAVATKADLNSPAFSGTPSLPTGTTAVNQTSSDSSTKLATTFFVQQVAATLRDTLYPIGSIYTNAAVNTNPATLLGFGTWTAFGTGRVLVGVDASNAAFDTLGETGGSADAIVVSHTHTGTTNADGVHSHNTLWTYYEGGGGSGLIDPVNPGSGSYAVPTTSAGSHSHTFTTNSTGSSATNANLQPYVTVYMWKRTA